MGRFLYFIEDNQRFSGRNCFAASQLDELDESPWIEGSIENGAGLRVVHEIEQNIIVKFGLGKVLYEPRFSGLSWTLNNKGLAIRPVFPGDEFLHSVALHVSPFSILLAKYTAKKSSLWKMWETTTKFPMENVGVYARRPPSVRRRMKRRWTIQLG